MIGLIFLTAGLAWLAFSVFLALKVPQWMGIKAVGRQWVAMMVSFVVLLMGPFVDEIVGMQQFERLCLERTMPRISQNARSIEFGRRESSVSQRLAGYWIDIEVQIIKYFDVKSGNLFLEYEYFKTKGGRIAGLVLFDGWHTCSATQIEPYKSQIEEIPAYQNIVNGVKR